MRELEELLRLREFFNKRLPKASRIFSQESIKKEKKKSFLIRGWKKIVR